ncbi:MAG: hypothetical protein PUD96_06385, partial [Coriobacteriaceae bacterium]|nr:hypothetical protein [Coriobacteriaceae bacterium]
MGQVKDIACSVWRRLKGAAASLCSAVTGPARGAHSAPAAAEPKTAAQDAGFAHGAHGADAENGRVCADAKPACSAAPAPAPARPARARSSRGAHTASSRRRRVIAARGAHSAPRAPRPSVPVNLNTAPAAA